MADTNNFGKVLSTANQSPPIAIRRQDYLVNVGQALLPVRLPLQTANKERQECLSYRGRMGTEVMRLSSAYFFASSFSPNRA